MINLKDIRLHIYIYLKGTTKQVVQEKCIKQQIRLGFKLLATILGSLGSWKYRCLAYWTILLTYRSGWNLYLCWMLHGKHYMLLWPIWRSLRSRHFHFYFWDNVNTDQQKNIRTEVPLLKDKLYLSGRKCLTLQKSLLNFFPPLPKIADCWRILRHLA